MKAVALLFMCCDTSSASADDGLKAEAELACGCILKVMSAGLKRQNQERSEMAFQNSEGNEKS